MNKLNTIKSAIQKLSRNEQVELRIFLQNLTQSTSELRPGQNVFFKHSKTGVVIEGTIRKINRKTIRINSKQDKWGKDCGRLVEWIVPPTMLEVK